MKKIPAHAQDDDLAVEVATLEHLAEDRPRGSFPTRSQLNLCTLGGHRLGGPVSLEKSLQVANEMLAARGLAAAIHLEQASGISRNNHFTARGLAEVLELFAPPTPTCSTAMTAVRTRPAHGGGPHARRLCRHLKQLSRHSLRSSRPLSAQRAGMSEVFEPFRDTPGQVRAVLVDDATERLVASVGFGMR